MRGPQPPDRVRAPAAAAAARGLRRQREAQRHVPRGRDREVREGVGVGGAPGGERGQGRAVGGVQAPDEECVLRGRRGPGLQGPGRRRGRAGLGGGLGADGGAGVLLLPGQQAQDGGGREVREPECGGAGETRGSVRQCNSLALCR